MNKLIFVLNVTDEVKYNEYRAAFKPLMDNLGIVVLNEYRVSDILHSTEREDQINRLVVFGFPSEEAKTKLFSDPIYQEAKKLFKVSTKNFAKILEQ